MGGREEQDLPLGFPPEIVFVSRDAEAPAVAGVAAADVDAYEAPGPDLVPDGGFDAAAACEEPAEDSMSRGCAAQGPAVLASSRVAFGDALGAADDGAVGAGVGAAVGAAVGLPPPMISPAREHPYPSSTPPFPPLSPSALALALLVRDPRPLGVILPLKANLPLGDT